MTKIGFKKLLCHLSIEYMIATKKLLEKVRLIDPTVKEVIDRRLAEFHSFADKTEEEWFSELCFCLLTANSRAKTAIAIQKELGFPGFISLSQENLAQAILRNKHRFYNNKSKYICQAREHRLIKSIINTHSSSQQAREWLVSNIKGLGYKEASHFLRNTGHEDLAILDRHILRLLNEHDLLEEVPKTLTPKKYKEIEKIFKDLAIESNMTLSRLDLCMWYLKTGEVLK